MKRPAGGKVFHRRPFKICSTTLWCDGRNLWQLPHAAGVARISPAGRNFHRWVFRTFTPARPIGDNQFAVSNPDQGIDSAHSAPQKKAV